MLVRMENSEKKRLAKDADKYIIRLPDGMRDQINAAAKANKRSMNAEIIDRLQVSFLHADIQSPHGCDMDKFADDLATKLAEKLKSK
jgi:hypothetical protein